MEFLDLIDGELDFQRHMLKQFNKMKRIKASGKLFMVRKQKGYKEYYIRQPGEARSKYVRREDMTSVHRLQAKALGKMGADRAGENIRLLKALLDGFKPCDFYSIQQDIDEKFRFVDDAAIWSEVAIRRPVPQSENPKRREELKHSTTFGLMVRSKNEGHISEGLMSADLEFYYEKALRLIDEDGRRITIYPDFTIMMPDGREIFWEHKGMLDNEEYLQMDAWKTRLYYLNGIYQPHNLIVTCDGPNGEYPGAEIGQIIERIRTFMHFSR